MVRKHIDFYGRVQGVGFRYSARYFAQSLMLTGWVKNNWDGSVEMEIQGDALRIDDFLDRLENDHFIKVDHMDIRDLPVKPESSFRVR